MKTDYHVQGIAQSLTVEIEKTVVEKLQAMEKYSGHKVADLVNVALKRFISHHKDFLPPEKHDA